MRTLRVSPQYGYQHGLKENKAGIKMAAPDREVYDGWRRLINMAQEIATAVQEGVKLNASCWIITDFHIGGGQACGNHCRG